MHASWKTGTAQRASETDYVASYSFDKNLSATFVFADFNNVDSDNYQSRLYISYKF